MILVSRDRIFAIASSRIDQGCIWFGDWIPSRRGYIFGKRGKTYFQGLRLRRAVKRGVRWKTDLRKPPPRLVYLSAIYPTFDRRLSCSFFFSIGKRSFFLFFFFFHGNYEDDGSRASRRGFRKHGRKVCARVRGGEGRWIKVKVSGARFPSSSDELNGNNGRQRVIKGQSSAECPLHSSVFVSERDLVARCVSEWVQRPLYFH